MAADINISLDAGDTTRGVDTAISQLEKLRAMVDRLQPVTRKVLGQDGQAFRSSMQEMQAQLARLQQTVASVNGSIKSMSFSDAARQARTLQTQMQDTLAVAKKLGSVNLSHHGGRKAVSDMGALQRAVRSSADAVTDLSGRLTRARAEMGQTAASAAKVTSNVLQVKTAASGASGSFQQLTHQVNLVTASYGKLTAVAQAARAAVQQTSARAAATPAAQTPQAGIGGAAGAGAAAARATAATQTYTQATQAATAAQNQGRSAAMALANALGFQAGQANNLHSAYRGLASGFGAMWLTWGAALPLLTGAAISHSVTSAVRMGTEVSHTLTTIGALGEVAAKDVAKLNEEILRLGHSSTYGPRETAEALKTLALAGLNAQQQMAALPEVLNFAKVGELPLNQAAETLVAVGTAYGYSADQYERVGDVIAKTAAISMVSVQDMAASFRQSTSAAAMYKVSLEDMATGLALLGQAGVRGQAAGTAMRQMYNELSGSTAKARKALDQLGISIFDNVNKRVRDLPLILGDVQRALSGLSFEDAMRKLQEFGNERGLKALSAALQAMARTARESGKDFTNEFARMLSEVQNSAGFMALAAMQMDSSTKSLMKGVAASIETSLVAAFQKAEPEVRHLMTTLRGVFQDPAVSEGVAQLIRAVTELATSFVRVAAAVAPLLPTLAALGIAYVTLRTGATALTAVMGAQQKITALVATTKAQLAASAANAARTLTVANGAMTASGAAATIAAGGFRAILGALNPVIGALFLAVSAWQLLKGLMGSTSAKSAAAVEQDFAAGVKRIHGYADEALKDAAEIAGGGSVQTLEQAKALDQELAKRDEVRAAKIAEHQKKIADLATAMDKVARQPFAQTAQGEKSLKGMRDQADAARKAIAALNAEAAGDRDDRQYALDRFTHAQKLKQEAIEASVRGTAQAQMDAVARNTGVVGGGGKSKTGAGAGANDPLAADRARLQTLREELELVRQYGAEAPKITQSEKALFLVREQLRTATDAKKISVLQAREALLEQAVAVERTLGREKEYAEATAKLIDDNHRAAQSIRTKAQELEEANQHWGKSKAAVEEWRLAEMKRQAVEAEGASYIAEHQAALARLAEEQERYVEALKQAEFKKHHEEQGKHNLKLQEQAKLLELEVDLLGLSNVERAKAMAAKKADLKLNEELLKISRMTLTNEQRASLEAQARSNAHLEAAVEQNRAVVDDFQRQSDQISQSLTDALMRGFENGKGFGRNFKDALKNTFKTMVLKPTIELVMKPIANALNSMMQMVMQGIKDVWQGIMSGGGQGGQSGGVLGQIARLFSGEGVIGQFLSFARTGFMSGMFGTAAANWHAISSLWANGAYAPSIGMGVGVAGGMLTSVFAGRGLGQAISNGYAAWGSGNGATNTGAVIGAVVGSIIPGIGTLVGSLIGGALGGLVNRVFGRKVTEYGIEGEFGGEQGFTGRNYEFHKGGWFRSDKTKYSDLPEHIRREMARPFNVLREQVKRYANILQLPAEALEKFTYRVRINLRGLKPEEATRRIEEELGKVTEAMARQILGSWDGREYKPDDPKWRSEYSREGESAIQTLTRLAESLSVVNTAFDAMGRTLLAASTASGNLASEITDVFGEGEAGRNAFSSAVNSYMENFYTEQERREAARRQLERGFQEAGLTMPDINAGNARQQFRDLVDSLDLTTESGRQTFAILMALQGPFASLLHDLQVLFQNVEELTGTLTSGLLGTLSGADLGKKMADVVIGGIYDAIGSHFADQITRIMVDGIINPMIHAAVTGASVSGAVSQMAIDNMVDQALLAADRLAALLNSTDFQDAMRRVSDVVERISGHISRKEPYYRGGEEWENNTKSKTDAALQALEAFIDQQVKLLRKQLDAAKKVVSEAKAIRDMARSASRELYGKTPNVLHLRAAHANEQIHKMLLALRGGALPEQEKLKDAIEAARAGLDADNYASYLEYERDQLVLAGRLAEIGDLADDQLTSAEKQVKKLEEQIDQLNQIKEHHRQQINLMRTQGQAVTSIDEGVKRLVEAMEAERAARAPKKDDPKKPTPDYSKPIGNGFGAPSKPGNTGVFSSRKAAEDALRNLGIAGGMGTAYYNPMLGGWQVREVEKGSDERKRLETLREQLMRTPAHHREEYRKIIAGRSIADIAAAYGYMSDDVARFLKAHGYEIRDGKAIPAFARGGFHAGGLALVGEEGPELVQFDQPARIYNRADTQNLLAPGDGGETAALRQEVAAMRAVLLRIADATQRSADTLRNVTPNGDSLRVEAAEP